MSACAPATRTVFFGAPVWNHSGFVGKLYPRSARKGDFLYHYARQFNSIELNTTYYGADALRLERWRDATPPGFRFSPKFERVITHDRRLRRVEDLTEKFCNTIRTLGDRLGPLWALLPPSFGPADLSWLAAFLKSFPADLQLAVEVRHPDWFAPEHLERLLALFEEYGVITVISDTAGRRDVLHMRLSAPHAFIRFGGNSLHASDYSRLAEWADRLAAWFEQGLETVWFFFHQPDESQASELGVAFAAELRARGIEARPPQLHVAGVQGELFG